MAASSADDRFDCFAFCIDSMTASLRTGQRNVEYFETEKICGTKRVAGYIGVAVCKFKFLRWILEEAMARTGGS